MSWEQLGAIVRTDAEERQRRAAGPPVDCPNDGTALDQREDGKLVCPFDGWVWEGEAVTW